MELEPQAVVGQEGAGPDTDGRGGEGEDRAAAHQGTAQERPADPDTRPLCGHRPQHRPPPIPPLWRVATESARGLHGLQHIRTSSASTRSLTTSVRVPAPFEGRSAESSVALRYVTSPAWLMTGKAFPFRDAGEEREEKRHGSRPPYISSFVTT